MISLPTLLTQEQLTKAGMTPTWVKAHFRSETRGLKAINAVLHKRVKDKAKLQNPAFLKMLKLMIERAYRQSSKKLDAELAAFDSQSIGATKHDR